MPKKAKALNVTEIKRGGKTYFRARLVLPFDEELGRKPSPIDFIRKTEAEAIAARAAYKPNAPATDTATTLLEYVRDTFIPAQEAKANAGLQDLPYTKTRVSRLKAYFLDPADKGIRASKLRYVKVGLVTRAMVIDFFDALKAAKPNAVTVKRMRDDLKLILGKLYDTGRLSVGPADLLGGIEAKLPGRKKRTNWEVMDIASKIADQSLPLADRCLVAFQFFMQCRPSEMFALTWNDLDLDNGTATFTKAMRLTAAGWIPTDGTKSEKLADKSNAERVDPTVSMPPVLTVMLRFLSYEQAKSLYPGVRGQAQASEAKSHRHVFRTVGGLPLNKDNFKNRFRLIKKNLGLADGPSFYSLKHLGNTFALLNGVSLQAQADRMRHTSTKMAAETYKSLTTPEKKASVDVFARLFPGAVALGTGAAGD